MCVCYVCVMSVCIVTVCCEYVDVFSLFVAITVDLSFYCLCYKIFKNKPFFFLIKEKEFSKKKKV